MQSATLLLAIITFSLASCTTAAFIQHTPTLANTGQHTGKGQLHGNLLYSSGSSTSNNVDITQGDEPYESVKGIQAKGSYSISNAWAIQASLMHSSELGGSQESNQKNIIYRYNRNITEGGVAYYNNLGSQNNVFFEIGTGLGIGNYRATETASVAVPGGRFYDHNVFKVYLQPSVYYVSRNFCLSVGANVSHINFNDINTNYTSLERKNRFITTDNKLNTTTFAFFSKADVFLTKLPWLGLNFQVLTSTDLGKKFNTNQNDNNVGIGLSFRFDQLSGKK